MSGLRSSFGTFWRLSFGTGRPCRKRNRLRPAHGQCKVAGMDSLQDRLVLVPFGALDDTLELVRALVERLPHEDQLAIALRGAAANLRAESIMEP